MRIPLSLFAVTAAISSTACSLHRRDSHQTVPSAAQTSVFTDSVIHVQLCAATRPTEDWRKVCIPKDQGIVVRHK